MTDGETTPAPGVHVTRRVEATPETVFSILSTEEGFSAWMDGEAEFEAVAGSPFRIRFPRFATVVSGQVLEVVSSQLLVVSWGVSEGPQAANFPAGSSKVSIALRPTQGGTEVTLSHTELPSTEEAAQHEAGWRFHLSRLQLNANRAQLAEPLATSWAAWCAAWAEADDAKRASQLEACCSQDIHYADDYAVLDGRDVLSMHIGNTLKYVAHGRLESDGAIRICRGEALIPWRGVDAQGQVMFKGTLHARVGLDGRFTSMTSFWEPWTPPTAE